jgi:hypothetical protein
MRIGVFCLNSGEAVATDRLMDMKLISDKTNISDSDSLLLQTYLIPDVKKGFWIAGKRCDGRMEFHLCDDQLSSTCAHVSLSCCYMCYYTV